VTRRTSPVVVVGGGVIGLCAAYALIRRGVDVCVIDRPDAVPPASWGNAGWVVPALSAPLPAPGVVRFGMRALVDPASPLHIAARPDLRLAGWLRSFVAHCTAPAHAAGFAATIRLAEDTQYRFDDLARHGVEFSLWKQGLTMVALDRAVARAELDELRPLRRHGYALPSRVADGAELRALEPTLSPAVRAGFHIGAERHVDPRTLLTGLRRWLRAGGTSIREGTVTRCVIDQGAVTGVVVDDEFVPAGAVVLAAGAWTATLAARLGCRIPLQGGKGYSFSATGGPPVAGPLKLLEAKTAITPFDADVRVAGTMDLDGLHLKIRQRRLAAILAAARRYLTGWDNVRVRQPWAGIRPMTPDGLPVIGRVPTTANAYVATGHAMLGVTLGPATGDHLADLITTGQTPAVLEPFRPERFHRRPVVGRPPGA
jgi:D-amino-acid dehydrogenase